MKVPFLATVITLSSMSAWSQEKASPFPTVLQNVKTERHVLIPGSRVYIIPPPGFLYSAKDGMFEKGKDIMLHIDETPEQNFFNTAKTITPGSFQKEGKVLALKDITVSGYAGKLAIVCDTGAYASKLDSGTKFYQLAFGDKYFTVNVLGVCPANDTKTANAIERAIRTLVFDKSKTVDPFSRLPFELNAGGTDFRLARKTETSNIALFNKTILLYRQLGNPKDTGTREPFFQVISTSNHDLNYGGQLPLWDIIQPYKKNGLTDIREVNESAEKVNDLESLQEEVYGRLNGDNVMIYAHVVLVDDQIVYMAGIAHSDFSKYLVTFKKISNSIRRQKH